MFVAQHRHGDTKTLIQTDLNVYKKFNPACFEIPCSAVIGASFWCAEGHGFNFRHGLHCLSLSSNAHGSLIAAS